MAIRCFHPAPALWGTLARRGSRATLVRDSWSCRIELKAIASSTKAFSPIAGSVEGKSVATSLDFGNPRLAFEHKTTLELFRTWAIFRTCGIGFVVRNCDALYGLGSKILPGFVMRGIMRKSFFGHFCAGETCSEIVPKMEVLKRYGIGGILDYAAEAKDEEAPAVVHAVDEAATVGAPLSALVHIYEGEATCDANAEIFLQEIRAVREATPDGFAAIKLSGLGDPALLGRMSKSLEEVARLFKKFEALNSMAYEDSQQIWGRTPYYMLDRSFRMDFETFSYGWSSNFEVPSKEHLRETFDKMDDNHTGFINFREWSKSLGLSEINALCRSCLSQGPLYKSALDEKEIKLYFNMINRVERILDLARELEVRVMIDAEWADIQPAIDHIVLHLQRTYNRGDVPVVFQTYQTYLKGMSGIVHNELERSREEGWRFGAKVVRGAYMVSERQKSKERGVESPICETYEDTEENFHAAIDAILTHNLEAPGSGSGAAAAPAGGENPGRSACAEILVASHNRGSVEYVLRRLEELGRDSSQVYFGQLLGMADHLTFMLGTNGYKAYKYVPYGPIDEVMPYLLRRTQENSTLLGSAGVQEERAMVKQELLRRLRPF